METGVTNLLKTLQSSNLKVLYANQSMQVNTVKVPESDIMATNGVVHFVRTLLYPEDIPVGSQELRSLLTRIIRYIQIKYVSGYRFQEIPLTFMRRVITVPGDVRKVTRVIQGEPTLTKVTRVIEGDPMIKKVTRVIEGQPSITKVTRVIEGQPSMTKVTRVIEGDPIMTKVTRVVEDFSEDPESITSYIQEGRRVPGRRQGIPRRRV